MKYSILKHTDNEVQVIVDRIEVPTELQTITSESELLNSLYSLHTTSKEALEVVLHSNVAEV